MFRIVAVLVLFLSVIVCGLQVLGVMNVIDHPDPSVTPGPTPELFVTPLLTIIAGLGLSAVLEGLARLVVKPAVEPDQSGTVVNAMLTLGKMQSALPKLITEAITAAVPVTAQGGPGSISGEAHAAIDASIQQHLQRMVTLMEEMKEVSMLDESQRKVRRQQASQRRKGARLEEAAALIKANQWEQADALLHLLESLHPGDSEVLAARNLLDDNRILHQADGWDLLQPQVEYLLSQNHFGEARQLTAQFLERYPNHLDCQQLDGRVKRQEQETIESHSAEVYERIRSAVESRQWRRALEAIQQFLQTYPDHARAPKIRQQVRVVEKNAEIEERHEQEEKIRELINSRRYTDAAILSEDLLARFPDSPQAAYLAELLPKLRERSGGESEGALAGMTNEQTRANGE